MSDQYTVNTIELKTLEAFYQRASNLGSPGKPTQARVHAYARATK